MNKLDISKILDKCRKEIKNIPSDSSKVCLWIDNQLPDGSWKDIDYYDENPSDWQTIKHLERIKEISYCACNDNYELVSTAVCRGLKFWFSLNPKNPNWWYNDIGKQIFLRKIGVAAYEYLSYELKAQLIENLVPYVDEKYTGANLVWLAGNVFYRGIIAGNGDEIMRGIRLIESTIPKDGEEKTEGIQPDFSFTQHGRQLYSNGYGRSYLIDIISYMWLVYGTEAEFSRESINKVTNTVIYGNRFMFRYKTVDFSTEGREIARYFDDSHPNMTVYLESLNKLKKMNDFDCAEKIERMILHINGSVPDAGDCGTHLFPRVKYMTRTDSRFYTSVRMFSNDVIGAETYNGEGLLSGYGSFGVNPVWVYGDEYDKIFAVWDWGHLPGVTGYALELPTKFGRTMQERFVGGVSDGIYGFSAMKLDTSLPAGEKNEMCSLKYKKAYFFFENETAVLISDLYASGYYEVHSTLNQCLLKGKSTCGSTRENKWFWHNQVGYIFPDKYKFNISTAVQNGNWRKITKSAGADDKNISASVFKLYINHGNKPCGAEGSYIIIPNADEKETAAYASEPNIEIIYNEKRVQAVRDKRNRILQAVFYQQGKYNFKRYTVEVSKPCMLMYYETDKKMYVSNPELISKRIDLTVCEKDKCYIFAADLPDSKLEEGNTVAAKIIRITGE